MRLWADEEFHFLQIAHCRGNLGRAENEAPAVVFVKRKAQRHLLKAEVQHRERR